MLFNGRTLIYDDRRIMIRLLGGFLVGYLDDPSLSSMNFGVLGVSR